MLYANRGYQEANVHSPNFLYTIFDWCLNQIQTETTKKIRQFANSTFNAPVRCDGASLYAQSLMLTPKDEQKHGNRVHFWGAPAGTFWGIWTRTCCSSLSEGIKKRMWSQKTFSIECVMVGAHNNRFFNKLEEKNMQVSNNVWWCLIFFRSSDL